MMRLSLTAPIVATQAILNVFLVFWLYMEYVHNRFLRDYLAAFWNVNYAAVVVLIASGSVGVGSLLFLARRRGFQAVTDTETSARAEAGISQGLARLDVCPFCNVPLKTLSDDRFHCRRCGRYFKK